MRMIVLQLKMLKPSSVSTNGIRYIFHDRFSLQFVPINGRDVRARRRHILHPGHGGNAPNSLPCIIPCMMRSYECDRKIVLFISSMLIDLSLAVIWMREARSKGQPAKRRSGPAQPYDDGTLLIITVTNPLLPLVVAYKSWYYKSKRNDELKVTVVAIIMMEGKQFIADIFLHFRRGVRPPGCTAR